ncbi:hypothetical protein GYMLUDRAFT_755329 [Collybiopsis luxurians FD-317 M1]|uniref:PPPDE domain-containing protein n=1 Tax=Collybiopsis luxurians FD-317 M1 TaxID=944289 RepID=A0A0D0B2F1_9AGAR|nr:hypothetical protein GYMLUDRAFT_755329 [Collybiopsis luxurians FD-317 M1]
MSVELLRTSYYGTERREVCFSTPYSLMSTTIINTGFYSSRYGEPVLVSIPVFKLCGHFVLYTTTHKYELRLDRTSNFRPYFLHRPLTPTEISQTSDSLNANSPRYHYFVSGWTHRTHTDIVRTFNEAITHFGSYNRLTNNCRTFLQSGCGSVVQTISVWHEDMLMVDPGHVLLLGLMAVMMYRAMLRELCRWVWCVKWGPDWESTVQYHEKPVDNPLHKTTY